MRCEHFHIPNWARALAVACIAAAGLVAIVGSGGGGVSLLPDWDNIPTPPPPPASTLRVEPEYVTRLAGTSVTFTAQSTSAAGDITYQWSRSFDGGKSFVDIAGATGRSYSLSGVTLADDGAVFRVVARPLSSGRSESALGHLAIATRPAIVFADGEFLDDDWLVSPVIDSSGPTFVHSDERAATGGNPGAFRRMTEQLQKNSIARVFYLSKSATYDPATQGAVYVIDYAEDCIDMESSELIGVYSDFVIEQAGRRYYSFRPSPTTSHTCNQLNWSAGPSLSSLGRDDFRRWSGPACDVGEICPDFSANGKPMRFGFLREVAGSYGVVVVHGIDNWKVTVWGR